MLLTLMMNIGMFGPVVPVTRMDLLFDSLIDYTLGFDSHIDSGISEDSTIEQTIIIAGFKRQIEIDSRTTLSI